MLCTRCLRQSSPWSLSFLTYRSFATSHLRRADPPSGGLPPTELRTLEPAPVRTVVTADDKPRVRSGTPAGTVLRNINFYKNKSDPIALDDTEYPEWLWTLLDKTSENAGGPSAVGDAYSKSKKARALAKKQAEKVARMEAKKTDIHIPPHRQSIDLPFATVPDPTAPSAVAPSTAEPFTRVVSAVGDVAWKIAPIPGTRGLRPATVEIGKDVQITPLEAQSARLEIKKALRREQRKDILEKNFLSTLKS